MKRMLVLISVFMISIFGIQSVNAISFYENEVKTLTGYSLSYEQYDMLINDFKYTDDMIDKKNDSQLDVLINQETKLIQSSKSYIVTNYLHDVEGNVISSFSNTYSTLAEAEKAKSALDVMNAQLVMPFSGTSGSYAWDSGTKMVLIMCYKNGNTGKYTIELQANWNNGNPKIKKYDIMAVRWTNNVSLTNAYGAQQYSSTGIVNYSYKGNNMVIGTKGVGISMNLVDSGSDYSLSLYADVSGLPGDVYGTYQHASNSNVTLAISKSYTFSSAGLGGVVYFSNSKYRNYYDDMLGVELHLL